MIKPQKSNLDNLIVVLVWFVLYVEDTFSPRMHWLWVKILVFSLSPLFDIFCSYYESKLLYTTNARYKKKKKKRTHHKQDTNTQQLTRTRQTKTRKQLRLLKLNPLEKKSTIIPTQIQQTSLHYQAPNNSQVDFFDILLPKFLWTLEIFCLYNL